MAWFESIERIEMEEELLRAKAQTLPESQRKDFFKLQSKQLKDPDTYAALNWLFLGGIHHFYLRKYLLFAIELCILVVAIVLLALGFRSALLLVCALTLYELPHLFCAQRIVRQWNLQSSQAIYHQLRAQAKSIVV